MKRKSDKSFVLQVQRNHCDPRGLQAYNAETLELEPFHEILTCSLCLLANVAVAIAGEPEGAPVAPRPTFHAKVGWKAENFFDDAKVQELCHAIESNQIEEIRRLIAAGVDVNTRGKDNMTPLLWAYPDSKLERFKCLLELGADPNIRMESHLGVTNFIGKGMAVTHMASISGDYA